MPKIENWERKDEVSVDENNVEVVADWQLNDNSHDRDVVVVRKIKKREVETYYEVIANQYDWSYRFDEYTVKQTIHIGEANTKERAMDKAREWMKRKPEGVERTLYT